MKRPRSVSEALRIARGRYATGGSPFYDQSIYDQMKREIEEQRKKSLPQIDPLRVDKPQTVTGSSPAGSVPATAPMPKPVVHNLGGYDAVGQFSDSPTLPGGDAGGSGGIGDGNGGSFSPADTPNGTSSSPSTSSSSGTSSPTSISIADPASLSQEAAAALAAAQAEEAAQAAQEAQAQNTFDAPAQSSNPYGSLSGVTQGPPAPAANPYGELSGVTQGPPAPTNSQQAANPYGELSGMTQGPPAPTTSQQTANPYGELSGMTQGPPAPVSGQTPGVQTPSFAEPPSFANLSNVNVTGYDLGVPGANSISANAYGLLNAQNQQEQDVLDAISEGLDTGNLGNQTTGSLDLGPGFGLSLGVEPAGPLQGEQYASLSDPNIATDAISIGSNFGDPDAGAPPPGSDWGSDNSGSWGGWGGTDSSSNSDSSSDSSSSSSDSSSSSSSDGSDGGGGGGGDGGGGEKRGGIVRTRSKMVDKALRISDRHAYRMRKHGKWEEHKGFEKTGGKLTSMSPDAFLKKSEPLNMDQDDKHVIGHFKKKMAKGKAIDPLALYAGGGQDGRHRAHAAKQLGIKKVPVITWPEEKRASKAGGGVSYSGNFSTPQYATMYYEGLPKLGAVGSILGRLFPNPTTTGAYNAYMQQPSQTIPAPVQSQQSSYMPASQDPRYAQAYTATARQMPNFGGMQSGFGASSFRSSPAASFAPSPMAGNFAPQASMAGKKASGGTVVDRALVLTSKPAKRQRGRP